MKQFRIKIASFTNLNESIARDFFKLLIDYENGVFKPLKCDTNEPLKEDFDEYDFNKQLSWLQKPSGILIFNNNSKFLGNIENKQKEIVYIEKNGKQVPFGNAKQNFIKFEITLWIKSNEPKKLERFFRKLYSEVKGGYGFLTMEDDYIQQNFVKEVVFGGYIKERFAGDNLNEWIPGIYWLNIFGKHYRQIVEPEILERELQINIEDNGESIFIEAFNDPEAFNKPDAQSNKSKIRKLIGEDYIFNKYKIDSSSNLYSYFESKID